MKYLIAILYALLITTNTSAQSLAEKPMLPKHTPSEWTIEDYLEYLVRREDTLKCDRSDHAENQCMILDVRQEIASVTIDLMIDDPDFNNKDYLIEYRVDRQGGVKDVRTYNASGIVKLESLNMRLESMNPVPRKALANNPETHQLATWRVVDYFEIRDGKVIVPPSDQSK